eukprot:TRINITY_DN40305_c0_g1_i1.p3 TRINITY_DN40305_c0_g1~~TRINITY_DN40305_c0_g1_i1.p3  ORF type:complete len:106 (+),score=39.66 TRINITY_DN40305_c0_g1_i1:36-353(+)
MPRQGSNPLLLCFDDDDNTADAKPAKLNTRQKKRARKAREEQPTPKLAKGGEEAGGASVGDKSLKPVTTKSGLRYQDLEIGENGKCPRFEDRVTVRYTALSLIHI